jgi:hypothetical protein
VQVLDRDGRLLARDHHRIPLPHDVVPAQSVELRTLCPVPDAPGPYRLKVDLVVEGVTWFEAVGSPTVSAALDVV